MTTSMTYEELKVEIRLDDISHDPWGTSVSWLFSVCDVLTWKRSCGTPNHWEFTPGLALDSGSYAFKVLSEADDATLIRFGNLLERFSRAIRSAGKSY